MRTQISSSPYAMSSLSTTTTSSSSFDEPSLLPFIIPTNNLCSNNSPTTSSASPFGSENNCSSSSSTLSLGGSDHNLIKSTGCEFAAPSSSSLSASDPIPIPSGSLTPSPYPFSFGGYPSYFGAMAFAPSSIPSTPEPLMISSSLPPAASNLPLSVQKQLCQNLFDKQTTEAENEKWMPMQRDFQHFLLTGQNPEQLAPGWKEFGHRGSI